MRHIGTALGILIATVFLTVGLAPATAQVDGRALVQITWQNPEDLDSVETAGVPVYAQLTGQESRYLLAGTTSKDLGALLAQDLEVHLLDTDMRDQTYFLAYLMPGQPLPDWSAYGRVLLDDGVQVLLSTPPQEAERLTGVGVEIRALTLTPKPLRPAQAEGSFPTVNEPDPLIQAMIDQVDITTIFNYTGDLSGEWPVEVGGAPYTISTRYTYSGTPIRKATRFVSAHLENLGLDVEYHQWAGYDYPNVIGELAGSTNPDNIFIIGGHLDDVPTSGLAPGADDNASGSVATLIAADILTQYDWGCTLRFAFWTGEEQGMNGSEAYAARSYNRGENILGYLNLDMISWNTIDSSPNMDLHANSSVPASLQLAQLFADVVDAYGLDLIPQVISDGTGFSDHASFLYYGYTSILAIEDYYPLSSADFNPRYHTSSDKLQYLDMDYYTDFVKASVATFAHMSGCLIPGAYGYLDGTISAASDGAPIENATVTMIGATGSAVSTLTGASGYYTQSLVAGPYTITAEAYSYLPVTATNVVVMSETVTTQDFSLAAAPTYVVSGTVTDVDTGSPLLAHVDFVGSTETAWTDPATGIYQATLPEGAYTMYVTATLHHPEERPITVNQDQTQDFTLEPLPCILLVDDDNNSPNVRGYFKAALDNMGYDYDVFDVGTGAGDGPSLAEMENHSIIIWFSGDKYGTNDLAGPNSADEANLAAYLDGGGMLFLSSQDYLYDMGATSFGQNYLGIGSYTNDKGHATTKYGLAGDPIGGGLGPYALDYPDNFDDWGDIVNANVGASVAFRSSATGGNNLDADKDGGNWRTVFFGTSWVPIYNESAANGEEVLQRIIDWFGGCAPNEGVLLGQVTDALSGVPVAGVEVTVRPSSRDTRREAILAGTGPSGRYTLTLTADIYDVTASKPGYYTQTATGIEVQAGMTTTQDLALQPMAGIAVDPLALEATLYNETSADQTLSLTNTSTTEMTFTLREESRTAVLVERQDNLAVLAPPAAGIAFDVPWLSEDPISGTLAPGEGRPITVTFDASGMAAGTYLGLLDVESSDLVSPHIGIPATLTVEFCDPVKIHEVITHTQGCTASFSADVSGTTPYSYAWDFGLFGDSTEPAPVVDFYADGTYPYTLTTHNCNATFSDMITGTVTTDCGIWCAPVRVITVTPNISGCAVTLDADLWGSPPYTYTWDLGEYGLYHEPTPEVDFTATGTYPYSLTTENCGAVFSDTMTGTLEVACQPHLYLPVVLRGE